MDPFHFACPHCSSRLRVREKLYVGRQVDCPECGDTLLIVDRAGELAVERVERRPQAAPADGKPLLTGEPETVGKNAGTAAGQRVPAASTPRGTGAAVAEPIAAPPARAIAQRIFASGRRAAIILGACVALIAILLAIHHFVRSPESTGGSEKSSLEVAADPGVPGAKNASDDGTLPPGIGRPTPSADNDQDDGHDTGIATVDQSAPDDSERGTSGDGALPLAGNSAFEGEPVADDRPIDPDFAPEPPAEPVRKIDLAVSLKQPIARFDQPRSKPLEEILVSVAEMAGARVTVDRDELGPAAARLAEPMALKLENTTVGEILSGLLHPAGLSYRIEGERLRVVRANE
jgi:hypothetical protein